MGGGGGAGAGYGYPQPMAYPPQGAYPPQPNQPQQGFPPQGSPPQGYPQQPGPYQQPVPPQAQPPYPYNTGYPTQSYPQQSYPQQGYPPQSYPQPPAPKRGLGRGAVLGIIGGVLALAIVATVIVITAGGGKGGGDGVKTLGTVWTVPSSGSDDSLVGSWMTSSLVVRTGSVSGVSAYDLATGHKAWHVTPPSGASTPCAMSPTVAADGVGTIGFGPDTDSCKYIVGVDTATGAILWKVLLTDTDHPTAMAAQTFVQGSVATVLSDGRVGGFNTRTGKEIWFNPARGKYCDEQAFGTTGAVVVSDFCADVDPEWTLTSLNPATGKRLWRKPESKDVLDGTLLNANPLVASLSPGEAPAFALFSKTGTQTAIDDAYLTFDSDNPLTVRLTGQTLVVQTADNSNNNANTAGEVIAYSLTSGQRLWRYNGESKHGAVLARTASGSKLYALSTGTFGGSPHFVRLDPATGRSTILGALPSTTYGWLVSDNDLYVPPGGGLLTVGASYQDSSTPPLALYR